MKFWKKVLVFLLLVGVVVGGIWGLWGSASWLRGKGTEGQSGQGELGGQEIAERPLKFAVMSDIHADWENFRKALEKAKEEFGPASTPPSGARRGGGFVIITGDLTTIGKKSELVEAKKILDESGLQYYVIPGNHDIWWGRKYKRDVWQEVFGESFASFKATKQQSNKEIKFILVNNADGVGGFEVRQLADGGFGQKEWLKREIEECVRVYCLVFLHEPLNHPNSLHVMGEESPAVASEAAQLIKLFVDNKIQEIFAGHLHFSSSYELEGLKTTIVGAIASERNFQSPKFLEVSLEGEKLEKKEAFFAD